MIRAKLRIINSRLSGKEFVLTDRAATIGRSSQNDFVVPDQSVSRQHVRVRLDGDRCVLTDLGSHNGIVFEGATLRELTVGTGDRFELGDVAIEFRSEQIVEAVMVEPAPTAAAAPAPPASQAVAPAQPAGALAERPVFVDDLFGPGGMADAQTGVEEAAAVGGARSALIYLGVLAAIIVVGAIAWNLAGGQAVEQNVKSVMVKANEEKVVDLGLNTRMEGGRLVTYYDPRDRYYEQHVENDVASLAIEVTSAERNSGFMAVVRGIDVGRQTDVRLRGPGGRRCIVRILVRGQVPRASGPERLSNAERLQLTRNLLAGAESAGQRGHTYLAMQQYARAAEMIEPVRTPAGTALFKEADVGERAAEKEIDEEFDKIKFRALLMLRDADTPGVVRAINDLKVLIPDENDLRHKKLRIIYDRAIDRYLRQRRG